MSKKRAEPMTKNVSVLLARTQFGQIFERVSRNDARFLVTKNGQTKAIVLGIEDFIKSFVKTPQSLATLQEQSQKLGTDQLSIEDIEREIQEVRKTKTL
ncbi:MAG: type II toxin-antitoxin system prevent-host-death family antitoxin [Candidatus Competibacter sp.]